MSKAIREAEKRARERQLQRERKPYEELRMAAKVKPRPIEKGSIHVDCTTMDEVSQFFAGLQPFKYLSGILYHESPKNPKLAEILPSIAVVNANGNIYRIMQESPLPEHIRFVIEWVGEVR